MCLRFFQRQATPDCPRRVRILEVVPNDFVRGHRFTFLRLSSHEQRLTVAKETTASEMI